MKRNSWKRYENQIQIWIYGIKYISWQYFTIFFYIYWCPYFDYFSWCRFVYLSRGKFKCILANVSILLTLILALLILIKYLCFNLAMELWAMISDICIHNSNDLISIDNWRKINFMSKKFELFFYFKIFYSVARFESTYRYLDFRTH